MSKTYHMCMSLRGFIQNHIQNRAVTGMFKHDDGRSMTPTEAKDAIVDELMKGHEVIPMADCNNFDPKHGCQGHDKRGPQ